MNTRTANAAIQQNTHYTPLTAAITSTNCDSSLFETVVNLSPDVTVHFRVGVPPRDPDLAEEAWCRMIADWWRYKHESGGTP
ncbi:MAG: hypothetical protein GW893_09605 [Armatimonadetes bacterium]|nr:hypothetical protein [Armatimonadota bacterium]